jgi:dihydrofolate synthase/folylpolyglutamate synthase
VPADNRTLRFLFNLQFFGIKAGLETIRELLTFLGNPERRFPAVHIAGTNGKGSTASMIASILTASGYRTGLYTSPHLVEFSERIRIDGKPIPRQEIIRYARLMRALIEKLKGTFFEATTAMAFKYFADKRVDVAVIETGLGGRWDATNVITPLVSVITNIGLEHTEYLGSTIPRIAFEKGGIIKHGAPCITGATQPPALKKLQAIAGKRGARLIRADRASSVEIVTRSIDRLQVKLQAQGSRKEPLTISLAGDHQARNAQLAVLAVRQLQQKGAFRRISGPGVRSGMRSIRRHTGLRGRLELVHEDPWMIADVAHNPDSIATLIGSLRRLVCGNFLTVFGVMRDKNYREMIRRLAEVSRLVIAVRPRTGRALETRAIVEHVQDAGTCAIDGGSVASGAGMALKAAGRGEWILVTGSHYVVGELLIFLNRGVKT